ncbi:hypothetical protein HMPREF9065_00713 [Aggregatibacter sp. oral taxon 458 str. W10330]|nr:hypothetical protein HMPREF9065_00713 [Aggregatibacter sp. oral taxon 458 str. W10330]
MCGVSKNVIKRFSFLYSQKKFEFAHRFAFARLNLKIGERTIFTNF